MRKFQNIFLLFFCIVLLAGAFATSAATGEDLKGRILLQVQNKGEAFYINPTDGLRYYLSRPQSAWVALRQFGLGISDKDLQKVKPFILPNQQNDSDQDGLSDEIEKSLGTDFQKKDSDNDGYNDLAEIQNGYDPTSKSATKIFDQNFSKKLNGKIVLQVENKGQAWYINPSDGFRYYLGNPNDALAVMKKLGLGISNNDLQKIAQGKIREDIFVFPSTNATNNQTTNTTNATNNTATNATNNQTTNTTNATNNTATNTTNNTNNQTTNTTNLTNNQTTNATNPTNVTNNTKTSNNQNNQNVSSPVNNEKKCDPGLILQDNKCKADKNGCMYTGVCGSGKQCVNNFCLAKSLIEQKNALAQNGVCCFDNYLKVGSFSKSACVGDNKNVEMKSSTGIADCRTKTLAKGYRYSTFYKTTSEFAIVCTEPCAFDDQTFVDSSFIGHKLGFVELKEATGGIMPKQKAEIHIDKDGDCEYNKYYSGGSGSLDGHPIICNANYYWFIHLKGTSEERDYLYYQAIDSQTLTIHEPVHSIFDDYSINGYPDYVIQEAFCKGISLTKVGSTDGYLHEFFSGKYNLDNLPPKTDNVYNNFFVYSLAKRFGFDENDTKLFFQIYASEKYKSLKGNARAKAILDEILKVNTKKSFEDLGLSYK